MKLGISDKGLRRIAQFESNDFADLIQSGDLAGWFVHAADKPLKERNTGYITLFVEGHDYTEVEHYGDYYTFVEPSNFVYIENIADEVLAALRKDYEDGYLSGELESYIESQGDEIDWEEIKELLDPRDLVDSAGWWDNADFTSWFNQKFDYNFIVTYDGAVMFDIEQFEGNLEVITQEQLDAIWDF